LPEEMGATYKIIDISKVPSAEAGRAGKYDLIVTYQDSTGRVRLTTIPWEEWADKSDEERAEILKKYIRREEEARLKFVGREIKI